MPALWGMDILNQSWHERHEIMPGFNMLVDFIFFQQMLWSRNVLNTNNLNLLLVW